MAEIASPSVVARRFSFVRETDGPNDGTWVSLFQRFTGNRPGDSWCASFVSLVLDIVYRGHVPLRRSASCQSILDECTRKGFVALAGAVPQSDDLFFYVNAGGAHHMGIVTDATPLGTVGIAGNTSSDGASSNGTGVFEHALAPGTVFARLPR
jgi:hypothetical protein